MQTEMKPMSRAERKKLELRQEIIDASFACFAEKGYHQTGIADIAAQLGIGHGTFYRYFESKRDIIDQVVTDLLERIVTRLTEATPPEAPRNLEEYRAQTVRISEELTGILTEDLRVPKLLLLEATSIDEELTERVFGFFDTAALLNSAYLQHGVDQGYLRADLDVEFSARAVNGMIMAVVLNTIRNPDAEARERFTEAIRELMFRGIVA